MKFINLAKTKEDIQIVFEIPELELVKQTLESVIVNRLPDKWRDKIFFADFTGYPKFERVKALQNVKVVVSPDKAWEKQGFTCINYAFDSRALYLALELEKLEKMITHLVYFLEHEHLLVTQVPRNGYYPRTKRDVARVFAWLHKFSALGADIETTSLKFYKAKLVSISFAVSPSKGVTFHVKRCDFVNELVEFFKTYQGRLCWHNGSYDVKTLSFMYFNSDSRTLMRTYEDTMFLHFICTNSPERPQRSLGVLAEDLCGSYKLTKAEITDMMNVNVDKVCNYNLDDSRATLWLWLTYRNQIHSEYFYQKLIKWQWALIQMELTGVPYKVSDLTDAITKVKQKLSDLIRTITQHPYVEECIDILHHFAWVKYNETHVGNKELHQIARPKFNPASPKQVKTLFEKVLKVTSPLKTGNGNESYGTKAFNHIRLKLEDNPDALKLMDMLIEYSGYSQLHSTFLKPMLGNSRVYPDGTATLHGTYNLARVVSGRLSSSDPNLQNLPSHGELGKIFKRIISAPVGKIMGGADYASLEERVNTILTKDPNKRKVYTDGYDGHSYRALYYFGDVTNPELLKLKKLVDETTNIQEQVKLVNSIKKDFSDERDASKPITFLLQYLGTAYGLRLNCGLPAGKALAIEKNYHEMYVVSDEWLQAQIDKASEVGYVEVAYGLRVYCSSISKSVLNSKYTPRIVSKHIRTIGNALGGQAYGQLTVDAGMRFLERVYENNLQSRVALSMTIHDALYPIWDNGDVALTKWVNDNLIECMEDISELPELMGDIPIIADLEYFSPNWATMIPLPKFGSLEEIKEALPK